MVLVDITEQTRVKEALRVETVRRRILFEQSPDGILIIDPRTGRFLEFNTAAHERLGYSREEFAQLTLAEVEVLETTLVPAARIADVMQKGRVDFEIRHRTRQGEVRNIHVTEQVLDVEGERHYQCVWRDITELKRTEEKLRQLSAAVEQSPTITVITNVAGDIEYVNPKFVEFTGYTAAEVAGRNPRLLQSGHTKPEIYQELWRTIMGGKSWHGVLHNKKRNGELYWESTTISPIVDSSGRTAHFVALKGSSARGSCRPAPGSGGAGEASARCQPAAGRRRPAPPPAGAGNTPDRIGAAERRSPGDPG